MTQTRPTITSINERPRIDWDEPTRGTLSFHTLFSSEITPTGDMCAGVALYKPGDQLRAHRHAQAEIYYILAGEGVMTIDGLTSRVVPGSAIFIPGDAEHGIRNEGAAELTLFYVFPTGAFADVVYRFTEAGPAA